MTFRPLFFLPRSAFRWALDQAYAEKLMKHWVVRALFCTIDRWGIWFPYKDDEVGWTWPWRRNGLAPFISLNFSGDGSFGDARYWTLDEIDRVWEMFLEAGDKGYQNIHYGAFPAAGNTVLLKMGELVALKDRVFVPVKDIEHESSSPIAVVLEYVDNSGRAEVKLL